MNTKENKVITENQEPSLKKMKCIFLKKDLSFCKENTRFLFCKKHWVPFLIILAISIPSTIFLYLGIFEKIEDLSKDDIIQTNKPNITCELVVDTVISNSLKYYFRLSNNGDMDIENVKYKMISPNMVRLLNENDGNSRIAVGGKIELIPIEYSIPSLIDIQNSYFKIDLAILFQTNDISEDKNNYYQLFKYFIPFEALKERSYDPNASILNDTTSIELTDQLDEVQKIFEGNEGSLYMVSSFPFELNEGVSPILASNDKLLEFNPKQNKIIFRRIVKQRKIELTVDVPRKEKNLYILMAIWSDSITVLGVDKNETEMQH